MSARVDGAGHGGATDGGEDDEQPDPKPAPYHDREFGSAVRAGQARLKARAVCWRAAARTWRAIERSLRGDRDA